MPEQHVTEHSTAPNEALARFATSARDTQPRLLGLVARSDDGTHFLVSNVRGVHELKDEAPEHIARCVHALERSVERSIGFDPSMELSALYDDREQLEIYRAAHAMLLARVAAQTLTTGPALIERAAVERVLSDPGAEKLVR